MITKEMIDRINVLAHSSANPVLPWKKMNRRPFDGVGRGFSCACEQLFLIWLP